MTIRIWNHGHPMKTDDPITAPRQKWTTITIDEFFGDVEDMRRKTILESIKRADEPIECKDVSIP